jgi:hypothetical protein
VGRLGSLGVVVGRHAPSRPASFRRSSRRSAGRDAPASPSETENRQGKAAEPCCHTGRSVPGRGWSRSPRQGRRGNRRVRSLVIRGTSTPVMRRCKVPASTFGQGKSKDTEYELLRILAQGALARRSSLPALTGGSPELAFYVSCAHCSVRNSASSSWECL